MSWNETILTDRFFVPMRLLFAGVVALGLTMSMSGVRAQTGPDVAASPIVALVPSQPSSSVVLPPVSVQMPSAPQPVLSAPPRALVASVPLPAIKLAGPQWQDLTKAQQEILRPLTQSWASLSAGHKSKWIALAQTYPFKTPAEQGKMQGRMAEWAALKPSQRELARFNFTETKKLAPTERAADWEAYKALSPQERKRFAAAAATKPIGAALVMTPLPKGSNITPVSVTRRTAAQSALRPRINPNTLLPLPRGQVSALSVPEKK